MNAIKKYIELQRERKSEKEGWILSKITLDNDECTSILVNVKLIAYEQDGPLHYCTGKSTHFLETNWGYTFVFKTDLNCIDYDFMNRRIHLKSRLFSITGTALTNRSELTIHAAKYMITEEYRRILWEQQSLI